MKTITSLGTLCLLLFCAQNLLAQTFENPIEDFGNARERYLGAPYTGEGTQLLPVGIDLWEGDDVNTIHYGRTPSGSQNKPVLVFVHGYTARASVWFEGRDNMYADVYRDGYRSVFVSLAPNKHMWTNGNMLANIIDKVTAHYSVSKVTLVGWSKGGVDTDAALVHFGANSKVAEVFTLSTPHQGTAIAEWANSILLGLVNIVFMQDNDGTRSLQRGYMNYFRSITNNNSNNTVHYTTLGGWGNGPLARLGIPQGLLHVDGGSKASGGNDGVVPYKSSKRPGGLELFSGQRKERYWWGGWYYTGPSQTELDHFEVTRGGLVWPYIKSRLGNNANRIDNTITPESYNPNAIVKSNLQIITSLAGSKAFTIEPNAGKTTILIGQEGGDSNFRLTNLSTSVNFKTLSSNTLPQGGTSQLIELEIPKTGGTYTLTSETGFVAMIASENGVEMELNTGLSDEKLVYNTTDALNFNIKLAGEATIDYNNVAVTGTIQRNSNLMAESVDDSPRLLEFTQSGVDFKSIYKQKLMPGIYTVTINAKGADFQKTVITSVAVVRDGIDALEEETVESGELEFTSVYPNPFSGKLNMKLGTGHSENSSLKIFNIYGQEVANYDLSGQSGFVDFTWNASQSGLEKGIYILQLSNGKESITKKVLMK